MRTSSYLICVEIPGDPDEVILIHGFTQAHFKVSRPIAAYIRSLEARRPPKPLFGEWSAEAPINVPLETPSDETIRILRSRGFLTDLSIEDEERVFCKVVNKLHEGSLRQMPGYVFMPTYNCNLRCGYCYQNHLRTNPLYQHVLKTMPFSIVDRIFKSMKHIENLHGFEEDGGSRARNVGFFGGEPLLASSRPIVENIIQRTVDLGSASFWAISNATELDAYEELLSPEKISSIQVTLDGPAIEHDKRRVYADGSGSFEKIAQNITMALDRGVAIQVRMNVDRNNISQLPALAEEILSRGWDKYPQFTAYSAPIRKFGENVDQSTTMDSGELTLLMNRLENEFPIISVINAPDDGIKQEAFSLFENPQNAVPRLREAACGAHAGTYMFDAFASIFVCWEHVGELNARIGYIRDDGELELNADLTAMWRGRTVASNAVCRQCRYALYCGGGCAASALAKSGTIHSNFCDGFGSRFRGAVAQAYSAHTNKSLVNIAHKRVGCGV
jgi:uncharacterized protein